MPTPAPPKNIRGQRTARSTASKTAPTGRPSDFQAVRRRARAVVRVMHQCYPQADCALEHRDPLQLLVATILSAQCTDATVNKVTPVLFARYPTVDKLAAAERSDVEPIIRATGFFRQKARNIITACQAIVADFGKRVPDTMEELLTLPGVARKTANVVLGTAFGKNDGFVVDTHVGRLAHRLGLTWQSRDAKDAVKIEQDLCEVVARNEWTFLGHALIWHGRRVCFARKPNCTECELKNLCPSAFTFDKGPQATGKKTRRPAGTARTPLKKRKR